MLFPVSRAHRGHFPACPCPITVFGLLFLVLFLAAGSALAQVQEYEEVTTTEPPASTYYRLGDTFADFDPSPEFEVSVGWLILAEEDMDDTYGGLPMIEGRFSAQIAERTRLLLGAGYGSTDGNPYYGIPEFTAGDIAKLKVVPIFMGVRQNLAPQDRLRFNLGFGASTTWIQETLPTNNYSIDEDLVDGSGWIWNLWLGFGPEWRARDGSWALGLEGLVTGGDGSIGKGPSHEINLSGMGGRLYFTHGL